MLLQTIEIIVHHTTALQKKVELLMFTTISMFVEMRLSLQISKQKSSSDQNLDLKSFLCVHSMRVEGLEPPRRETPDPKSGASANSATRASNKKMVSHVGFEPTTP
jgi:hypothetical protein